MSLLELVVNPNSGRNILPDCCTPETFADVRAFHRTLPGYQPTPLVALPDLAKEVGVKGIYIKDESKRFGLNAFKALGASYAIHKLFPDGNVGLTVTATDGNHGKGMACSTHRLGGHAVVFMPAGTVDSRVEAIRAIGDTEVTVTDLNYDGTVATAAAYAKEHGGHLVQDTAFEGYEEVPQNLWKSWPTWAWANPPTPSSRPVSAPWPAAWPLTWRRPVKNLPLWPWWRHGNPPVCWSPSVRVS